jgi:hypothetical protein
VYLHGAHVVTWKDAEGRVSAKLTHSYALAARAVVDAPPCTWLQDLMFTSKQAIFQPPKAIRWNNSARWQHACKCNRALTT